MIKKINKIILIIILISILININLFIPNSIAKKNHMIRTDHIQSYDYDQLDQYQNNYTIDNNLSYSNYEIYYIDSNDYQWCAQSFKPTLPVLTKVNLLVYKFNISCVLILSIKDNLSGNDLVIMSKGSSEIFEKNNINWITFDFPDINVITNNTYYIVLKCYSGKPMDDGCPSFYSWVFGTNTNYINGKSWIINKKISIKWSDFLSDDFCFETYGCSNRPPENPTIEGPINGEVGNYYEYTFQTIDPDEDDIFYCVKGGDLNSEVCMGPFKSGQEAKATFSWNMIGTHFVRVKARDTKGAESDWAILEVKMPITFRNYIKYILQKNINI